MDQPADTRRRWEAALAQCGELPEGLSLDGLAVHIEQAGRDMTARIAHAMLQEGILQTENCTSDDIRVTIPDSGGANEVLVVRGQQADSPRVFPLLRLFRRDGRGTETPVEDAVELLHLVAPAVKGTVSQALARIAVEITDAILNDALCLAYRSAWNARLRGSVRAARKSSFWAWLVDQPDPQERLILLEQWGAVGHPYHPTHKTRRGMTPAEVLAYCPEFAPQVQVGLVAARRELTRGETLAGAPARERWLDGSFPAQAAAWRNALSERGCDPDDYVAIPVHPWQAQHIIPKHFARSLSNGDLVLLSGPAIPSAPLVSVRTLVPRAPTDAPHLKLSLSVRLTSTERSISPRSCEMGPRISRLLQDLIKRDAAIASTLRILPEEAGMYFASKDAQELEGARHLAAVLRCNPSRLCANDEVVIPTTALTADSPMTGAPLFLEISRSEAGAVGDLAAVKTRFAQYAEAFLRPLLTLYLRYGIGFEAHQQNTLVRYSRAGELQGVMFRDFGGIRIHESSLHKAGLELKVHPDRLTLVDDFDVVRRNLTSHALLRNIGFLVSRSCHYLQASEGPFWSEVADIMQTVLDELRGDVAAATWQRERRALLDEDWDLKANLRMRFEDVAKSVYVQSRNPLRRPA